MAPCCAELPVQHSPRKLFVTKKKQSTSQALPVMMSLEQDMRRLAPEQGLAKPLTSCPEMTKEACVWKANSISNASKPMKNKSTSVWISWKSQKSNEVKWNHADLSEFFRFCVPWKGEIHYLWHSQWNCDHRRRQCPTLPFWSGTAPNLNAPIGSLHICGLKKVVWKSFSNEKKSFSRISLRIKPEAQMECTGPKGKRPVQAIKGGGAVEEHGISHQLPLRECSVAQCCSMVNSYRVIFVVSYDFQVARSSSHMCNCCFVSSVFQNAHNLKL